MSPNDAKGFWWIVGVGLGIVAILYLCGRFVRSVANAISAWDIRELPQNETQLRKSLASHLQKSLPESIVIEEFGAERNRADIVVSSSRHQDDDFVERIAIELKYHLKSKPELDRLIGQVIGYKEANFDKAMVVSVDPEPNMHEVLKNRESVEGIDGFMMVQAKFTSKDAQHFAESDRLGRVR